MSDNRRLWQQYSHARVRLWKLIQEKFRERSGRWSVTVTRQDLIDAGVIETTDELGTFIPPKGYRHAD